jgi:hypothetical protein
MNYGLRTVAGRLCNISARLSSNSTNLESLLKEKKIKPWQALAAYISQQSPQYLCTQTGIRNFSRNKDGAQKLFDHTFFRLQLPRPTYFLLTGKLQSTNIRWKFSFLCNFHNSVLWSRHLLICIVVNPGSDMSKKPVTLNATEVHS